MRKLITIVLLIFKINFCVFPQAHFYGYDPKTSIVRINRFKNELPALKDFRRIDCLNDLSESYFSFKTVNNDTARVYAKKALKEAEKINYIIGQATAYRNLGRVECLQITDLPASERYLSKSLALFIKSGTMQQIAWGWGALGYSKWVLSKFSEAMDAFEKAEQLFKKIGDTNNLVATYNFMSNTERERGHYAKSLEYALKHKDLTGEEDYYNLSLLYASIGDDESALEYGHKAPQDSFSRFWDYLGLAGSFTHKKQYDSALYCYRLFSDFARIAGAGPLIKLHLGLGNLYMTWNYFDSALVHLNYALNLSKDMIKTRL